MSELLSEFSEASRETIRNKTHRVYFEEYFAELDAHTIVIESGYIDHDYLEDFTAYYVKCFHHYERECTRLHFFRHQFERDEFHRWVTHGGKEVVEQLQDNYLGFIVVKPLPESVIGRTCLRHYPDDDGRRAFAAVRDYSASLFGMPLSVHTLGFQEQDQVAAACATSALWSAFQATGHLWQHRLPSPIEITKAATSGFPLRSRAVPNTDGLTLEQMAQAIKGLGLEPYYINPCTPFVLCSAVYSYVACEIPVLLVFRIDAEGDTGRYDVGLHAAAVTGYSLPEIGAWPAAEIPNGQFVATRIEKLYAHDDQVGPHARMPIRQEGGEWWLETSWGLNSGLKDIRAHPHSLLVPLYNKIRIPYSVVYETILEFDSGLFALRKASSLLQRARPVWDIRLTTVNSYKESVRRDSKISGERGAELLFEQLPRFLWRATAVVCGDIALDILFDATDISSGHFVRRVDVYDEELRGHLNRIQAAPALRDSPLGRALGVILARNHSNTSS